MASTNGLAGDPSIDAALLSRVEVAEDVVASLARRVIALEDAGAAGSREVEQPESVPATNGKAADAVVAAPCRKSAGDSSPSVAPVDAAVVAPTSRASDDALLSEVLRQLKDLRTGMVSVGQVHQAELVALGDENAKLRYRIKHLLRALDAADEYVYLLALAVRRFRLSHLWCCVLVGSGQSARFISA